MRAAVLLLLLAACDGGGAPPAAGLTLRSGAGPVDELRLTTTSGELTVSGEASIGISGEL